jgi:hypothetical protein
MGCGPAPEGLTAIEAPDVRAALAVLHPMVRR